MTLPNKFETKEQYLEWRAMWRARYAEMSGTIRACKTSIRLAFKEHVPAARFQVDLIQLRRDALDMMALRAMSKQLVRERLRELGIKAPVPKDRPKPAPRQKKRLTPEEIAVLRTTAFQKREARHKDSQALADAHSD
jgi:hypothetical protein